MNMQTEVEVAGHRLPIVIERVNESYQATSPALEGFLVLADSLEEVVSLAPGVARDLLEAMQDKGATPLFPTRPQPLSSLEPLIGTMPAGGDALQDSEALYDADW
jgi:predicted RNase H-like HicB family nuclease